MQLGNIQLEATSLFNPNMNLLGKLAPGSTINFVDLLKALKIDIPDAPSINLTAFDLTATPASKSYSASLIFQDTWSFGKFGSQEFVIKDISADLSKEASDYSLNLKGISNLFGSELNVEGQLSKQSQLIASASNVHLTSIVDTLLKDISFPTEVPDVVFETVETSVSPSTKELSLTASSTQDWQVPLGVTGLLVEDLQFNIDRKAGTKKNTFVTSGILSGEAKIGTVSTTLAYNFPGDFVLKTQLPELDLSPVIQDLCGPSAMMGISIPDNIAHLKFTDLSVRAAPQRKEFSLSGNSTMGNSELIINKNQQGKWVFITAFAPPAHWEFSSIDSSLKPLDSLDLSNTALVISTADDKSVPLSVIQLPADISIGDGLTFFANLDLSNLGVKDLMNIESLMVSTNIDRNPANIKLAAGIGGSFRISESVSMGDMNFFIKPAPSNFELGISGAVMAKLDSSDLKFVGTMGIRPIERSAAFSATMLGFWNEPFGIKGLSVGDLAMEVGIGIVPPPAVAAPIVGLAGSIAIGTFSGSAAVKFDTANPGKSMIAAAFNQLYLREVVQTFCDDHVYNSIPADIRNTVLAVGMEDVAVYVVPQPTTIGELSYDQGFKFQGKLSIGSFDAQFFFLLSYSEGFAIKASMDPINLLDGAFVLAGSGGLPGPTLDVDLRIGGKPGILIAGLVKILGLQAQTLVSVSDKGFLFFVEGKIFNLFIASLTVSGGNLKNGGDFYIKALMRNDLIAYLREKGLKAIQDAADAATKDIESAQRDVAYAQSKVDGLQRDIDNMRNTVKAERARDEQNVRNAENAVNSAQNEVNKIQRNIDSMRNTIRGERDRDTKRLRDAQAKVTGAQNEVNKIQNEINSSHRRISKLNSDIAAKKRWYDNSKWYEKTYRWAEFSAYAAAKGTEITGIYTKIGGLETAKGTANLALEAAKQIVRGIEAAAKTFPIDADPRIVALFTAKGTASTALEATKGTLKLARGVIKVFPVDADPRIVGLFTAKGTATAGLTIAQGVLEATKATVGGLADVGSFIVKYGLGGLFDVKEARFEGQLNVLKGGSVSMGLKLLLLNKPLNMDLAFNFNSIESTVKSLTNKLIDAVKKG